MKFLDVRVPAGAGREISDQGINRDTKKGDSGVVCRIKPGKKRRNVYKRRM